MLVIPNYDVKISQWFTWKDALFLPKFYRMASTTDDVTEHTIDALLFLFAKMDIVRNFIGRPIIIHESYRSTTYNKLVGGALDSSHMCPSPVIAATDFHVAGMNCDDMRTAFLPQLDSWQMRMENRPQSAWIHLDTKPVAPGGHAFFIP